ncbi:MAG: AmmeMemoRadiSam system protein A [Deltaproteobacteria bacterium]|nr:AmmeMemoRadiSam system protein A [Deltaproteobacteria bacterium]
MRAAMLGILVCAACSSSSGGRAVSEPARARAGGAESAAGPSSSEKRLLLSLARAAIEMHLRGEGAPGLDEACRTAYLSEPLAVFVTLTTRQGELRGCIGMFEPHEPLYRNVIDRAVAAATRDPRFRPVRLDELAGLGLEISILTRPQPLAFSSPEDLLARLRPGEDGVILESPAGSSTYLPQVWEQLPDKAQFLSRLCQKHGAQADCWRRQGAGVQTYQAIVFGEHDTQGIEQDWFVPGKIFRCSGR